MNHRYGLILLTLALTACQSEDSTTNTSGDQAGTDTTNTTPIETKPIETKPVDTEAPSISLLFPTDNHSVPGSQVTIKGSVTDNVAVDTLVVAANDTEVTANIENGAFSAQVALKPGQNQFQILATDTSGNQSKHSGKVYFGKQVTAGGSHSGVISASTTYAWGRNNFGQTGLGTVTKIADDANHPDEPVALSLEGDTHFISLAFNQNTSLALASDGTVWSWGYGKYGQLGLGNEENQTTPQKIPNVSDAAAVARGYSHSLILHQDGSVSTFGQNSSGQLGNGTTDNATTPQRLSLSDIVQVTAGSATSFALDKSGNVWGWGANKNGAMGQSSLDTTYYDSPIQIPMLEPIENIAAGKGHVVALGRSGAVYAWGLNASSQVGFEDDWGSDVLDAKAIPGITNGVAVWANGNQSFLEKSDRKIYPWGQNGTTGSLGISGDYDITSPTEAVFGFENPKDLGSGALHVVALRNDDKVFSWGWSFEGSLGAGNGTVNRWGYRVPVFVELPGTED